MKNISVLLSFIGIFLGSITMGESNIQSRDYHSIEAINDFIFKLHDRYGQEFSYNRKGDSLYFPIYPWELLILNPHFLSEFSKDQLNSSNFNDEIIPESLNLYEWKSEIFLDWNRLKFQNKAINIPKVRQLFKDQWKYGHINDLHFEDFDEVNKISKYMNMHTRNTSSIRNIMDKDELTHDTQVVILSTKHFHSPWKYSFNINTNKTQEFTSSSGVIKNISMMENEESYKSGNISGIPAEFIILPFKNERSNMIVIVPHENIRLKNIQKAMTHEVLSQLFNVKPERINLYLPKFRLKTTTDFYNYTLIKNDQNGEYLRSKKIIQKTYVDSSSFESGTTLFTESSFKEKNKKFIVNRPFLVIISRQYRKDNIVLFYARVNFPSD